MSADPELGLVYLPVEMPSVGLQRLQPPRRRTVRRIARGGRRAHRRTPLALPDGASRPLGFRPAEPRRFCSTCSRAAARSRRWHSPPSQAFLFVLNRETGEPIWPIEERPVPQSESPFEKTSPTQPFPTRPQPFDRQGFSADVLNDLTPALRAEAERVMAQYHIGPLYTPRGDRSSRRPARYADVAGRCRRRQLARRQLRSRDEPPLHSLAYGGVHAAEHPRQSPAVRPGSGWARRRRSGGGRPPPAPPAGGLGPRPGALGAQPGPAGPRDEHLPARHDSADQAAVRPHHGVRHEHGRDALAESPLHDARQHPQQPCAGGTRCVDGSAPTAASSSAR